MLQFRLTDNHAGAVRVGQRYLSRLDLAGEWWAVLASLPTGGLSHGREPLSGPLTSRPVAMILGLDQMTPGLGSCIRGWVTLEQNTFQGRCAGGATVDGFLQPHSYYQTEGVICLFTSKPSNVQTGVCSQENKGLF